MKKSLISILVFVAVIGLTVSKRNGCVPTEKTKNGFKCNYGKSKGACIPRVKQVAIKATTPRGFVVTWKKVPTAYCYYIEILTDHSSYVYKTISCHRLTSYKVTGLRPWTTYAVRVSAVDRYCERGRESKEATVKTLWAPKPLTTTTARPIYTPKVGKCGREYFTCKKSKKKCIPRRKYCNKVLNCDDGSDERGCPGGCKEIKIEYKNGNYSCSRWGSPGSVCRFECESPYRLDGATYTQCNRRRRKWTRKVPTCRLPSTKILRILEEQATKTSLSVQWEPVANATRYNLLIIEMNFDENSTPTVNTVSVSAAECCKTVIPELEQSTEYEITLRAIDQDDTEGLESLSVIGRTV